MKIPLIVLAVASLLYGVWAIGFVSTGMQEINFDSAQEARQSANDGANATDLVIRATGASNSFDGISKEGYVIVQDIKYSDLKKNQFVVYMHSKGTLIYHRLRIKTKAGWMIEGDGNRGHDIELVTPSNLFGVVRNKTIYRYE